MKAGRDSTELAEMIPTAAHPQDQPVLQGASAVPTNDTGLNRTNVRDPADTKFVIKALHRDGAALLYRGVPVHQMLAHPLAGLRQDPSG